MHQENLDRVKKAIEVQLKKDAKPDVLIRKDGKISEGCRAAKSANDRDDAWMSKFSIELNQDGTVSK